MAPKDKIIGKVGQPKGHPKRGSHKEQNQRTLRSIGTTRSHGGAVEDAAHHALLVLKFA